jgi:hypothetical protein
MRKNALKFVVIFALAFLTCIPPASAQTPDQVDNAQKIAAAALAPVWSMPMARKGAMLDICSRGGSAKTRRDLKVFLSRYLPESLTKSLAVFDQTTTVAAQPFQALRCQCNTPGYQQAIRMEENQADRLKSLFLQQLCNHPGPLRGDAPLNRPSRREISGYGFYT